MFRKMSEALTFQLVKNKILTIEAYEIWAYSIEIILLNGSILLGCLLISFMLGEMTHMLSFVLFFIPLRMLVGGYHCRKSETCFFCTLLAAVGKKCAAGGIKGRFTRRGTAQNGAAPQLTSIISIYLYPFSAM